MPNLEVIFYFKMLEKRKHFVIPHKILTLLLAIFSGEDLKDFKVYIF
jgi:hypothetical protein